MVIKSDLASLQNVTFAWATGCNSSALLGMDSLEKRFWNSFIEVCFSHSKWSQYLNSLIYM